MELPCKDCLTLSMCIAKTRTGLLIANELRDSCKLFKTFLDYMRTLTSEEKQSYREEFKSIFGELNKNMTGRVIKR